MAVSARREATGDTGWGTTACRPAKPRLPAVTAASGGARTLVCPHCGLMLTIERVKRGTRLSYDAQEWRRLCKHIALDSPVLCLLEKNRDDAAGGPARH